MQTNQLKDLIINTLDDMKAASIQVLDVRSQASFTDYMIIAIGNSDRHVKSMAYRVAEEAKTAGIEPLGIEGEQSGEWVLVDLVDVVLHVMLQRTHDFYQLDKLWSMSENSPKLLESSTS